MSNTQTYFAAHHYEIIPCHIIGKTRNGNPIYKANSKRDKRRFLTVYKTIEEARNKVIEYETKIKNAE